MADGFFNDVVAANGVYKYYVNGAWRESSSGKTVAITNPSTRETAFQVQGKAHTNRCMAIMVCSQLTFIPMHILECSLHTRRGE